MNSTPLFYFENISNPTEFEINAGVTYENTSFLIRDRVEKGWTLDFIFNMNGVTLATGNTFYYWGVKDEYDPEFYVDNNVSFQFTPDNKIVWKKSVYSNYCGDESIIINQSGQSPILCTGGTSSDFNVTITFERNLQYDTCCDLLNEGGANDLFTGWTLNNPMDVMSGATEDKSTVLTLNEKWYKEKYKRLGTLKFYLNGRMVYKMKNWEEVIPTVRISGNTIVQVWGGGTLGSDDVHEGVCSYVIKRITYYETPFSYINVRDNYIDMMDIYDINECTSGCNEVPIS